MWKKVTQKFFKHGLNLKVTKCCCCFQGNVLPKDWRVEGMKAVTSLAQSMDLIGAFSPAHTPRCHMVVDICPSPDTVCLFWFMVDEMSSSSLQSHTSSP